MNECTPFIPSVDKLKQFPHACVAFSDTATWGSIESVATDTDVPSSNDELSVLDDSSELKMSLMMSMWYMEERVMTVLLVLKHRKL